MKDKKTIKIYLYTRFERLWHWFQALTVVCLIVTGLEIHGTYMLLGFQSAVNIHNFIGLSWLILFAFFVFWLLTTGEWKQYIPTTKKLFLIVRYYSWDIFQGKPHPVQKSSGAKHNPLQRLAYLGISAMLLPIQMVTGLLYYLYNDISMPLPLSVVAAIHTLTAFFLLNFLIIHLYMTTTGHSFFSHIAGMITGWEEIYETTKIADWETKATKK
ncbi:MAG: cytochrome b/b6 domain-containing protein [Proteobacteria bacterium]|nr:cytochrome b/b6 domain-containing protein [Pseudomonadota bacterium]MBU1583672.1 cytochrome b/b6 domain-containing protein [Pseudomonadota bacterium]MBU2453816.1 cytochrome b/b6 domain-containing protein [Pseudomonadota bacterium]MBU2630588.1 cytochrome b/b6 domain-containing protein [Pseudomonadota bacterium]